MTHPLLGVWLVEVDDAARSHVVHGFRADGTVLVTSAFHAAQGTWRPTGDRNADVVVMRPIESDDRSFVGWQAARGVVEVAEDGETYELSGSISRPTPGGGSDERPIIARGVRLRHDPVRHSGDPTDRDDGTGRWCDHSDGGHDHDLALRVAGLEMPHCLGRLSVKSDRSPSNTDGLARRETILRPTPRAEVPRARGRVGAASVPPSHARDSRRQEGGSVRRFLTGVVALWLVVAGVLALAPAVSAAESEFAGTWVSIDTDGSTQALAIGRGSTPAVTYRDFFAGTCANAGAPSTHFVATGRGTIDGTSLWVEFRNGGCGSNKIGPFGLGLSYNSGSDTLTDDFGITWYRFP